MSLLGKWFGFSIDEVFDEGVSAYDRGDYEAAIEAFEECLEDVTDNSTARLAAFYAGESYAQLGNQRADEAAWDDAIRHFRSAIKFCPNYPDLHLRAAKAADAKGDEEERDFHVRSALKLNPRYVDAMVFQGVCDYADGRREKGLELIARACEIDPDLDCERYRLALRLHEQGQYERVLANLRILSTCVSNDSSLHKRVGDSFMRDGMFDEAAIAYRRAIEITPRFVDARCRLAQTLLSQGRFSDALEEIEAALKINPAAAEAHALKGETLRMLEREIDARCEFRRAMEIDPNHPVALRERATLL